MFRKNDWVPAGGLVQLIAGDNPSPVATPGAACVNLIGMSAPSANPETVSVIGGAAAAPPRCPAAGCCAARDTEASSAIVKAADALVGLMTPLLIPEIIEAPDTARR